MVLLTTCDGPSHPETIGRIALLGALKRRANNMTKNPTKDRLRSMEEALADLVAKYEADPKPELARMIREPEMEIARRKGIRQEPL
jgi:hypothetical protein